MKASRFESITKNYKNLKIAVIGDYCLDRYLEIDADKREISIETGLPVYNVISVRSQPGGAGTILNNLSALGVGTIIPVGFAGEDGEGWELKRSIEQRPGVRMGHFFQTPERCTFTYTKPLVGKQSPPPRPMRKLTRTKLAAAKLKSKPGQPPKEMSRFDFKNWTATPEAVSQQLIKSVRDLGSTVDAFILLSQVDKPGTGVLTKTVLDEIGKQHKQSRPPFIIADSRTGLNGFPSVAFKMNGSELMKSLGDRGGMELSDIYEQSRVLAQRHQHPIFVTLAECGIVGANPAGEVEQVAALPIRGEIDIVGAGDCVTANITTACLSGATLYETIELANAAASVVIHQVGTTGTASVNGIRTLLFPKT